MSEKGRRPFDLIIGIGVGIALVGSAGLWADNRSLSEDTREIASDNVDLICSLGELISGAPVGRRPDESPQEFSDRVRLLREFARDLRDLDDCDPEHPVMVRIPKEDRPALQEGRRGGGDAVGPPPGGGGGLAGGENPPPDQPGLLDPVTDPLYDETGIECQINTLGIQVCSSP
jgi:hypothetical protein